MLSKLFKNLAVVGAVASLSACVIQQPPVPGDPRYAPVYDPAMAVPRANEGAIYRPDYGMSLFEDRKAHRVGDIITIVLNERTSSTKTTNVSMTKESELDFNENSAGNTLLGSNPTFSNLGLATNLEQNREFTGEADADQSNQLDGSITVTVSEVLVNGNLVVRGEKWMTLNRGDEYIRISGIIRPDDISPDNEIMSTKLANARITYSGTGQLADNTAAGWLTRFFNSPIWPF
ncbi:MAG: flagellar basal body L-ring protein FlgH [Candidatus Pelagadaptatus aseana]|uniref:flagellar basal body L-ring protein FlgH n=1 Tax=Candidatus Pelagadaptatus aseana TaxID=3120508 RepID=UPI0039B2DC6D